MAHWNTTDPHPEVTGILIRAGKGFVLVGSADMTLQQQDVLLRSDVQVVSRPVRRSGDVALARDVLDHQLVDIAGIQVVRAADVYLLKIAGGWEVAGVDVGPRAFFRRLLPGARTCPTPHRVIDWAELQSFVPRFSDDALPSEDGPAAAAGQIGGSVEFSCPAAELTKLWAPDVTAVLSDLGRRQGAQVAALAAPTAAAEALRELRPARREALLAEMNQDDRARLMALFDSRHSS